MADPNVVPNAFGDELYASVEPMAFGDADNDYALKTYCYAIAQMYGQLEQFARTDDDGNPPFSLLFDLDRATGDLIPYIAQFVGQSIPVGITDEAARELVRKPSNAERGTLEAVRNAVLTRLSGTKYLRIIERDSSPYHFTVFTRSSEQPISDLTFTNLVTNPNLAVDTTAYSAASTFRINTGATLSRATSQSFFGSASLQVDTTNSSSLQGADYGSLAVTAGQPYKLSVYAKGNVGGETLRFRVGDGTVGSASFNFTVTSDWVRYLLSFVPTGSGTTGFAVCTNGAQNARFFLDGLQVVNSYVEPGFFFDGATNGGVWNGTANASTSTVAPTTPNGTINAIKAVKPAGLIFDYVVTPGTTIDELTGTIDALSGTIDSL